MNSIPPIKPDFIAVTGPNGAGKSTFIRDNGDYFKSGSFVVIQPDFNKNHAVELRDAIADRKNVVIETPWNADNFLRLVNDVTNKGYDTSLYQLYFNSGSASWSRVESRNKTPYEMKLDVSNVNLNFNANFKNVAEHFFNFKNSYFIDARDSSLAASFKGPIITMLEKTDSIFLDKFADLSNGRQRMRDETFKALKEGVPFKTVDFKEPSLKFKY